MKGKGFRGWLPLLLAVLIAIACFGGVSAYAEEPMSVSDEVYVLSEGTCSSGVEWVLTSDGVLKFTGNGAIVSEAVNITSTQWSENGAIKSIIIGEGITSMPSYAFEKCVNLVSVKLPSTLGTVSSYAFDGCTSLKSVTFSEGITTVGAYSFRKCTSLETVVLPNGLTGLGAYAFYECTSLKSVQVPDTVYNIGTYAFSKSGIESFVFPTGITVVPAYCFMDCPSLKSVTLHSKIRDINIYAFNNCTALENIEFPSGMRTISERAFRNCDSLTTVVLPRNITTIGNYCFSECDSLESINIPVNMKALNGYAFYNCVSLKEVDFQGRLESIAEYAFSGCTSLENMVLPEGLSLIGKYVFEYCYNLYSVTLPTTLTAINGSAFYGCFKLVEVYDLSTAITVSKGSTSNGYVGYYAYVIHQSADEDSIITETEDGMLFIPQNDKNALIGYNGTATELYLPDYYDGKEYVIYNYALYGNKSLTSIRIGEGVTAIGTAAFKGCDYVEEYIFDAINCYVNADDTNGVLLGKLGSGVDVIIGAKVTAIPEKFLYNKGQNKIASVTFAEGSACTSIGAYAFYGCSEFTEIALPDSVTSIGNYAFYDCSALANVDFPESLTDIGEYSFYKCVALTKLELNDSVYNIGQYAFAYCSSIVSINIPKETGNIGYFSFAYTHALEKIRYDAIYAYGVSYNKPFYQAGINGIGITVTFGRDVEYIPSRLFYSDEYMADGDCPVLRKVVFEEGSKCLEIGEYAFFESRFLTTIVLPDSLTKIGNSAFYGCEALQKINIPKNVTSIGNMAFIYCGGITELYYNAAEVTEIKSDSNIFGFLGQNGTGVKVVIGKDVEVIPNYLLYRYASNASLYVTSVEFEEGTVCTTVGAYAFAYLDHLKYAEIGEAVTTVGNYAFYYCADLKELRFNATNCTAMGASDSYIFINAGGEGFKVIIGAGVTRIPDHMFDTYSSYAFVTEVIFEEGSVCEYIGYCAFDGCQKLTSVTLPDSVTTVSGYAFRNTSLKTINIPKNVTSIGSGAYYNCLMVKAIYFNAVAMKELSNSNSVFYKVGTSGDGVNVLIGKDVTKIPAALFYSGTSSNQIKVISILFEPGSSCKSIGNYSFYYLDDMESFDIPSTVTTIGTSAFEYCSKLSSIRIHSGITQVGSRAFAGCSKLKLVFIDNNTVASSIASSSSNVGALVQNATSVVFGESVTTIPVYVKNNFTNIEEYEMDGKTVKLYSKHAHGFESGNWNHTSVYDAICNTCGVYRNIKVIAEGACGKNVTWVINELGALYIMGEGAMNDYSASNLPWNAHKSGITSVTVDDGVTYVGKCAFYGLDKVGKVSISDTVTSIGGYAFFGCTALNTVEIPASVEFIGAYAFRKSGVKYLIAEVAVGWSVGGEAIAASDVYDALKMAKSMVTDNYTKDWSRDVSASEGDYEIVARGSCGDNAYWVLTKAGELIISGSGTTYSYSSGTSPWYDLRNDVVKITVCEGITTLGQYIFQRTNVTTVSLPSTLTKIGYYAFSSTPLVEITIPTSVTYVESGAFFACSGISRVNITDMRAWFGIKFVDSYANPIDEGTMVYVGGELLTEVTVPSDITEIPNAIFSNYQYLTKVVFHSGVTAVGSSAFENCIALTTVVFPESLTKIDSNAFYGCTSLTEITIPSKVSTVGMNVFNGCTSLTKVTFKQGASVIGDAMFSTCSALRTVIVPDTVKSIGSKAFNCCYELTEINIPEGVTVIKTYAFYNCSKLEKADIPSTVTSIETYAFEGCSSLASVVLPDGLNTIGANAFKGCSSINALNLPKSLASIGNYAFYNCTALTEIRVEAVKCYVSGSTNYVFGYAGNDGDGIRVIISSEVTEIPAYLFCPFYSTGSSATTAYAPKITSVEFEEGSKCTKIDSYAFMYCDDFTTLFIPESVTTISGMAFYGCNGIIYVYIANPALATNATSSSAIGYLAGVPTVVVKDGGNGVGSYISSKAYSNSIRYNGEDYTVYSNHIHDMTDGRWSIDPTADCIGYICDKCGILKNETKTVGGSISSRIEWALTDEGTLVISGEGAMPAYSSTSMPWYSHKDKITSVVINEGITSVGRTAFYGFTSLKQVIMADTVTAIGQYAFFGCTALTEINIPESVNLIEAYAFRKCTALKEVRFFNVGGWSAGETVFEDIVLFDFEYAAKSIVDTYFGSAWTKDTSVNHNYYKLWDYGKVNDSVYWRIAKNGTLTIYGSGTITATPWSIYKDEIYALTITDGITGSCGTYIRYEHLNSVIIGNGITSIPSSAFAQCTALASVTIGEGVTSIGSYAFDGCGSLRNLYFNAINCSNFASSNYTFRKAGEWSSLTMYVGPKVTRIPVNMFRPGGQYDKAYIRYVKFDANSVCTTIGNYAFYCCESLWELEIPKSITSIGESAISGCGNMRKLTYNAVNASIYNMHVFSGMGRKSGGAELIIGPDVERLPSYIFYCGSSGSFDSYVSLSKVTISEGSSLIAIGSYAFGHVSEGLDEVHVATLEDWLKIVFENRVSNPITVNGFEQTKLYIGGKLVTDIVIPEGTERINDYAFYRVAINSLSIPKSVSYIGSESFYCANINSIYFNAENCDDFAANSSYGVIGLNSNGVTITIGKDVKRIPAYFAYNSGSNSAPTELIFEAGSSCTEIGTYAFYSRTNLNYVTLPEGLTTVEGYAFSFCHLLRLELPSTLTSVGVNAFNTGSYYNLVIPESLVSIGSYGFRTQEYTVYINSVEIVKNIISGHNYASMFGNAKSIAIAKDINGEVTSFITDKFGKYIEEITYNGVAYVLYSIHTHKETATTIVWEDISTETAIAHRCKTCWAVKNNLIVARGTCGSNIEWRLFANGMLMITGEGAMANYSTSNLPWKDYIASITAVEIGEGVTSIGNTAFYGLTALTDVSLPSTITQISRYAFFGCTALKYIVIPENVTSIGIYSFRKSGVTDVRFENVNGWSVNGAGIGYARLIDSAYAATSLRDTNYSYEWVRNPKAESVISAYGNIGSTAYWVLTTDGELTISGSGNIPQGFISTDLRQKVVKVVIGDGITSIGNRAFYAFPVKSITIGAGVKTIGDEAFYNCTAVKELFFNATSCDDLNGNNTFYLVGKSGGGMTVTFGANVKRVPDNLFNTFMSSNVPYITNVKFASGSVCEYIGNYVFYNSYYLQSISIPASVKSIGNYAFWGCANIKELLIPENVKTVGNSAFAGCTALVSVNLKSVSIGSYCFAGCTSLTTVKLPYGMLSIGEYAFNACAKLSTINLPATLTSIGKYAFCGCESITSITIPNLITKIEAGTFDTCRGLTSITFGKGITTIGSQAFRYCISLTSITVPEGVTTLENYAFADCTYTTQFKLPKSLTYIGNGAFNNCLSIRSIEIPAGVTYIGTALFSDCDILRTITVAPGNKVYHATGNCIIHTESKTLIAGCRDSVIPNDGSVKTIGAYAFSQVYELREARIPYGVTEIEEYAFYNCNWLGEVIISDTVKTIGKGAFSACQSIFRVTIGRGVTTIGESAFSECDSLYEIVIPDTVVHIGAGAFRGCDYLYSVTIGNRVNSIGANAFAYTNLIYVYVKGADGWMAGNTSLSATNVSDKYTAATYLKTTYATSEWHREIVLPGMVDGGSCGKDAMWSLDANGVLTIYGEGCMYDYNYNTMPWYKYKDTITKLVVDAGIVSLGRCAFYGHTALQTVELPVTMMSIGEYAFFSASKLTTVNIPERVFSIGIYAFRKTALSSASFDAPTGWYIDGKATSSATLKDAAAAAASLKENFTLIWTRPTDGEGDIVAAGRVTSTIKWKLSENGILTVYGTGAIPNYASNNMPWYDYRYVILKVVIDEGITSIGKCSFYGCTTLSSTSIASTVTSIGQYAFYNCANMTSVNIPASVTKIEIFAFRKCTRLDVNFAIKYGWSAGSNTFAASELRPASAGQYLSTGFYNSVWVRDVNAPEEPDDPNFVVGGMCGTKAKWQLFWLDDSKTAMKLVLSGSGATTEFGTGAAPWYEYADKIVEIHVSGISTIGRCAFYNLNKVTKVTLEEGIEVIGDYAFNMCSALTEIVIPSSVTKIGVQAFAKSGVTSVIFRSANGWTAGAVAIGASDLNNTATAATYLKTTYRAAAWTKA